MEEPISKLPVAVRPAILNARPRRCGNAVAFLAALLFCASVSGELILDIDDPDALDDEGESGELLRTAHPPRRENTSGMDVICFVNRDMLRGELLSFDPALGILWKSPEAAQEILFKAQNVANIDIGKYVMYPDGDVTIGLTNGDSLPGRLIALGLAEAKLETHYGGILTVNRSMIQHIYPENEMPDTLFSGVGSIEDWKTESRSGGVVTFEDGVISLSGVCYTGRDMRIGDMARIDFSFESTGNCQFQLMFYAGDKPGLPRNCYWLHVSSGHAYLQRFGGGGSENLGMVQSSELRSGKGRLSLLADRESGKFTLLIDDAVSKQWVDTGGLEEAGSYVYFSNQTQGTLRISDLKVSVWNGKLPGALGSSEAVEEDLVVFINGDQISGVLQTIDNNLAKIKTEYAELSVPLERIKHLQTASSRRHLARRNSGDARFFFPDGRCLTFDLAKIADGKLIGRTENLGDVQIALDAFKSFDMNIYRDNTE
ncbi:MAG: hypothetical protein JW808_00245 [Victivallales bacterium]|nr:hypothetical protein [Victivallales bacterium]